MVATRQMVTIVTVYSVGMMQFTQQEDLELATMIYVVWYIDTLLYYQVGPL